MTSEEHLREKMAPTSTCHLLHNRLEFNVCSARKILCDGLFNQVMRRREGTAKRDSPREIIRFRRI